MRLHLGAFAHDEELDGEEQERFQVVVQNQSPGIEPHRHDDVLHVHEVDGHADHVQEGPDVGGDGELGICEDINDGAPEDGCKRGPCLHGRPRLLQVDGFTDCDEDGH